MEVGSMRFKRIIVLSMIISLILLICTLLFPYIEIDKDTINYNSNDVYNIKAYNAIGDINEYIKISNNIDKNVLGDYQVTVKVRYLFYRYNKVFDIKVVDNVKPEVALKGNNPSYVCPNKEYEEEGYTANDDYDGDITDKVNIEKNGNFIIYSVEDNSGNKNEIRRDIIFEDKDAPSITLKGEENIVIYKNSKYIEKGYTASDKCDGDITDKVIVTGTVDTSKVGTYSINYKVVDSSGNETSVDRKITVRERPSYYGNGSIYLTFDDGPSYLTKEILDILDEEGIKATFFVTSGGEYVKRAYNSGHTIALHTSSHLYSYVYSSVDNYFNDLNKVSDSVYNSIGIRCKIIRFPGGSSNTVSRNYNKGIMSRLVNEVTNKGYVYYDWNVDSNDAGSDTNNSYKIYNNVINGLSHSKTNIVLMHDSASHKGTVNALRDIIKYGKDNGYSFKAITSDTPTVRHPVNN